MQDFELKGYIPGAIGRIAEMHAIYYHRHWRFGKYFEAKVATELSQFLNRFEEKQDGFWTVCREKRVEGSIAIDGIQASDQGAHLRWFITSSILRGRGFGNQLIETAIQFCKNRGYPSVYLWTFEGLAAARHLYEKIGFQLDEEHDGTQWGKTVTEQKFVLEL